VYTVILHISALGREKNCFITEIINLFQGGGVFFVLSFASWCFATLLLAGDPVDLRQLQMMEKSYIFSISITALYKLPTTIMTQIRAKMIFCCWYLYVSKTI